MASADDDSVYAWHSRWEEIYRWSYTMNELGSMGPPATPNPGSYVQISNFQTQSCPTRPAKSVFSTALTNASIVSAVFSEAVKTRVKDLYGRKECWVCGKVGPDCCHVFGKEDTQLEKWQQAALIQTDPEKEPNAIYLCKSCHGRFDKIDDPGLVFFPSDLQYFIDYEEQDYIRRSKATQGSQDARRRVPQAADYKAHQVKQGLVQPNDIGGLYRVVFLKSPWFNWTPPRREALREQAILKQWHGDPMCTIRRAFVALGTLQIRMLDPKIKGQLQNLLELYAIRDSQDYDDPFLRELNLVNPLGGTKRPRSESDNSNNSDGRDIMGENRKNDGDRPNDPQTTQHGSLGHNQQKRRCRSVAEYGSVNHYQLPVTPHRTVTRQWRLGPNATTEDAVRMHAYFFAMA